MKNFTRILIILAFSQVLWAAGITFTFANVTFTGTSPTYYEFDVMAQADAAGTRLGDNQVYINYNALGFGTRIVQNGKLVVTKGTLLSGDISGTDLYNLLNSQDNSDSRVAVSVEFDWPVYDWGNEVPTTPTQLLHLQFEISDANQTAGLSFEQPLMVGQQYEADNSTVFDPVIATDTENSSLDPSGLEEVLANDIPTQYKLYQNFPNPFNPSTTLVFDVPKMVQNIELTIYDILGRKIVRLYEGDLNPGSFRYQWNGKNFAGTSMPTGVYYAVLRAPDFTQTIKMMLMK